MIAHYEDGQMTSVVMSITKYINITITNYEMFTEASSLRTFIMSTDTGTYFILCTNYGSGCSAIRISS